MTDGDRSQGGPSDEREPTLGEDEEAAWAAIVAGYGAYPSEEPQERTREGATPDEAAPDGDVPPVDRDAEGPDLRKPRDARGDGDVRDESEGTDRRIRSFTVYPAGTAPRDWQPPDDPADDHFTPPEPPPLPELDTTMKWAWTGALGGPLLLVGAVVFGVEMSWWVLTLGVGGFLCGFATLLTRLRDDDEDEGPGGGAVV